MVKGGGWLLLLTSDNEAGVVLTWSFMVGVVVEQETRTNFSEVRILPFWEFNMSHNRNAGETTKHPKFGRLIG